MTAKSKPATHSTRAKKTARTNDDHRQKPRAPAAHARPNNAHGLDHRPAWKKMRTKILKRITPNQTENRAQTATAKHLAQQIRAMKGKHSGVVWAGSSARDTHLRGDADIDLFVQYPHELDRETFEREGLRIGRNTFNGHPFEEAYSEHPYIRGKIKNFKIEIVPAYDVPDATQKKSSVDRSVFHHAFVQKNLSKKNRADVRLLKAFLKGIGAYGAHTAAQAVPGYLTELLIIHHKTFEQIVDAMARWKPGHLIDLSQSWNPVAAKEKFGEHALIVIDPVDPKRNVAAALSLENFAKIVAASQQLNENPSIRLFFPTPKKPLPFGKLKTLLAKKNLFAFTYPYPKNQLGDIAWGQARRLRKKIEAQLNKNGFSVRRATEWTDEQKTVALFFELETVQLAPTLVHTGPPVWEPAHAKAFLRANRDAIGEPRIENGHWTVEKKRAITTARELFNKIKIELRRDEKGPLRHALAQSRILHGSPIPTAARQNPGIYAALTQIANRQTHFGP